MNMARQTIAAKQAKLQKWKDPKDAPRIGHNPLIFSSPKLQRLGARVLWNFSTAAMWSLGLYLLAPLTTLSIWAISAVMGYTQLIANDVYLETVSELKLFVLIIFMIGAIIAVKLLFNIVVENFSININVNIKPNFRNTNRQSQSARLKQVKPEKKPELENAQPNFKSESDFKRMVAHHDDHGHLISVEQLSTNDETPRQLRA
jgi:poly-beta-1,6-N-acetyl-D-glucosamine biosynthesis protein PgaD